LSGHFKGSWLCSYPLTNATQTPIHYISTQQVVLHS